MLDKLLKQQIPQKYQHHIKEFKRFLELLMQWNKTYNLTAIRQVEDMVPLHLLDCISIIPYLKGPNILDVGSGAGFPGIPLAICCPEFSFTLVESNRKRVLFLETVKHELKLNHLNIWNGRIEQYQASPGFDTITSRAFSNLEQFIDLTHHVCAKDGQWCAMKGQTPHDELNKIEYPYKIYPYDIPGQNVSRCCVVINHKE